MKGDPIGSLKDSSQNEVRRARQAHAQAEGKTGRDYTASQAKQLGTGKRLEQYQNAKSASAYPRVATHEVLRQMRDAHQFMNDQMSQRERAKELARQLTGLNAGNLAKLENTYHDHSTVEGFDTASRDVALAHPELGFDPDSTDTPGRVWELIREGKQDPPSLHSREVAEQAATWLRESRKNRQQPVEQLGDAFDDFDFPSQSQPVRRSNTRAKDFVPFARSPGRTKLFTALAAGRSIAKKPPQHSMRFNGTLKLRASAGKEKTFREFMGSAYNGGVMYPSITVDGETQTLAIVLDLDSLVIPKPERPVLDDHDETTDGVIGHTTMIEVRKSDYTLPVAGVIYTRKERSKKILSASDGGHQWQLSVGTDNFTIERIPAGQSVRVNQRTFHGPVAIARNAYLTDLSFVAIGGDDTTYAQIAAKRAGVK